MVVGNSTRQHILELEIPDKILQQFILLAKNNPDLPSLNFFDDNKSIEISPYVVRAYGQLELIQTMRRLGIYNFGVIRPRSRLWYFVVRRKVSHTVITIPKHRESKAVSFPEAVTEALIIFLLKE